MAATSREIDDLMLARAHVERGEELVVEQRHRVAELGREGLETAAARQLLDTLERSLAVMRDHLAIEERLVQRAG